MAFVKQKGHISFSALEKLKQSNAAKLELETKKMEERIRSLKQKMMKEKEERERLGGSRWTSGRSGALTKNIQKSPGFKKNQPNGMVNKVSRRIKVLVDEPIDNYMRRPKPVPVDVNPCGQCENNASAWACHECSEKYCDTCFNQFHAKGALRKHTKTRLEAEATKENGEWIKSPGTSSRQENSLINNHMNGPSLLCGSYDENESAASFAQALQEWRNQNQAANLSPRNHPVPTADTSCGTSNEAIPEEDDKKELMIKFNSSITYGDRLYLKKNRENPLGYISSDRKVVANASGKKDDTSKKVECEEKENDKPRDDFTPNYREMIQDITTTKSQPNISSLSQKESLQSRQVVSFEEISAVESTPQDDQNAICIVEECEEALTDEATPSSSHGAVTICEMYSSQDFPQKTSPMDLGQSVLDNYVSPSIASKPFFLKPSGKDKAKKKTERVVSDGRKQETIKNKQDKCLFKQERHQSSARKSPRSKKLHHKQEISTSSGKQLRKTSEQMPVNRNKEKNEALLNTTPQTPSNEDSTKNRTRIPVRQAWKPKPTHKELSDFFLAGVNEDSDVNKECEEVPLERSSSTPITDLGQGSLSSTWKPLESYPHLSSNHTDLKYCKETFEATPDEDGQTSSPVAEIYNSSDDLKLTSHLLEEELLQVPIENTKKNSSKEEEELLELRALDDFGTGDQDNDDLATLDDLAWELASSTGRLTRCEFDCPIESDDDSIEDKDDGSGFTTPCTLERSETFQESLMDDFEEMERKIMEEEF